jgi:hypothetical protein
MGQKNTQLVTGINRGEFSELAFAINLLAKHLDWTVEKVHESMKVTSSTNRAKGSNSELRVVKPQNFIGVCL